MQNIRGRHDSQYLMAGRLKLGQVIYYPLHGATRTGKLGVTFKNDMSLTGQVGSGTRVADRCQVSRDVDVSSLVYHFRVAAL
jgi:hypothetical protein